MANDAWLVGGIVLCLFALGTFFATELGVLIPAAAYVMVAIGFFGVHARKSKEAI